MQSEKRSRGAIGAQRRGESSLDCAALTGGRCPSGEMSAIRQRDARQRRRISNASAGHGSEQPRAVLLNIHMRPESFNLETRWRSKCWAWCRDVVRDDRAGRGDAKMRPHGRARESSAHGREGYRRTERMSARRGEPSTKGRASCRQGMRERRLAGSPRTGRTPRARGT